MSVITNWLTPDGGYFRYFEHVKGELLLRNDIRIFRIRFDGMTALGLNSALTFAKNFKKLCEINEKSRLEVKTFPSAKSRGIALARRLKPS